MGHPSRSFSDLGILVLFVLFLPLLVFVVFVILVALFAYAITLYASLWAFWGLQGIHTLLVYSESPLWRDYILEYIRPRLPENTVVLNWSERGRWPTFSLAVRAFHFFGGSTEFNPMVVVIRPFRRGKTFRFWKAFRDYKHGDPACLKRVEQELDVCLLQR